MPPSSRWPTLNPEGRWLLAATGERHLHLWDLDAETPTATCRPLGTTVYPHATLSPDGRWLVDVSRVDRQSLLFDLSRGDAPPIPLPDSDFGSEAVFSSQGRWLFAGRMPEHNDSRWNLWDLSGADPAPTTIRGHRLNHTQESRTAGFDSGSRCLIYVPHPSREFLYWPLREDGLLPAAARLAGRNLTPAEWRGYFPGEEYRATFPDLPAFLEPSPVPGDGTAQELNHQAWTIVEQAGRPADEYREALRLVSLACTLQPDHSGYLNTLGVAQFRIGRPAEALATLTRCDELRGQESSSDDLAVIALCLEALRRPRDARWCLLSARAHHRTDRNSKALLAEAETVLGTEKVPNRPGG